MAMALAVDIGQAPQFVILSRLAAADFWMVCRMQQHLSFVAWQAPLYWGVKGSLGDFKNYTRMIENNRPVNRERKAVKDLMIFLPDQSPVDFWIEKPCFKAA